VGSSFTGLEPLEFVLTLPQGDLRRLWLARRLEQYRDSVVRASATLLRERGDKKTVAESEAQGVIETDGLTKVVPLEQPLYAFLLGGELKEISFA
jgi:hypothetical protein